MGEAMVATRVAIMVDIMETTVEAILEVMVGAMVATPEAMVEALEAFSVVEVPTAEDQTVGPQGKEDHLAAMEAAVGDTNQGKLVPIPTPEATPRKESNLENKNDMFKYLSVKNYDTYRVYILLQ